MLTLSGEEKGRVIGKEPKRLQNKETRVKV